MAVMKKKLYVSRGMLDGECGYRGWHISASYSRKDAIDAAYDNAKRLSDIPEFWKAGWHLITIYVNVEDSDTAESAWRNAACHKGAISEVISIPWKEFLPDAIKMYDLFKWQAIEERMDGKLRETVRKKMAPCGDVVFLAAYMLEYYKKYGKDFEIG